MEKEITGCKDCPFCRENDMASGYSCNLDEKISEKGVFLSSRTIKQNRFWNPVNPSWCILKTEEVLIKLKK